MSDIFKYSAIERSSTGIGVSTTARLYWRNYWAKNNLASMLGPNKSVNEFIAGDFGKAQPIHRFWLTKKESPVPAEIRKSHTFYYVAKMQGPGKYDIIAIQERYKEADSDMSKRTLTQEWVQQGPPRRK